MLTGGFRGAARATKHRRRDYYDFTKPTLPAPFDALRRTGLDTFIGQDGLLRYGAANLQPQSDDFASAQWTKRGIASVTSDAIASPFGGFADRLLLGIVVTNDMYSADFDIPVGLWTPSFWIKKISATGTLQVLQGTGAHGNMSIDFALLSSDWERLTPSHPAVAVRRPFVGGTSYDALQFASDTGTIEFYMTRVRAQPGAISNVVEDALLATTSAAIYLPSSPTYSAAGGLLGIQVQGPATNLLREWNNFTGANWFKDAPVTLTPGYGVGPDGVTGSATRLQFSGASQLLRTPVPTVTAGAIVSGSWWVKGNAGETISFAVGGVDELKTLTGSWQRLLNQNKTAVNDNTILNTYLGATARDLQIYGANTVLGAIIGSDIPNTGTGSSIRTGDDLSLLANAFGAGFGTSGTVVVRFWYDVTQEPLRVDWPGLFRLAGVSGTDLGLSVYANSRQVILHTRQPGGNMDTYVSAVLTTGWHTAAISWSPTAVMASCDGGNTVTSTGPVPTGLTTVRIGCSDSWAGNMRIGDVRAVPTAVPAATLRALSAI